MCDEQSFNFADLNLDFLELTPPQPIQGAPQAVKILTPLKSRPLRQNNRRQQLAQRITNTDELVQQVRQLQNKRIQLQQQLQELNQSALEIGKLYANEKQERIELQSKIIQLQNKCEELDAELAHKTLLHDQLQAQWDEFKGPTEYGKLAVQYLKLHQKLDEDLLLHWQEQALALEISKYCEEHNLRVPQPKSPKKRTRTTKVEKAVQCTLWQTSHVAAAPLKSVVELVQKESYSQGTQCARPTTRCQGTQYISTTTTRSTSTACTIKQHHVGTCVPEPTPLPSVYDMLKELSNWEKITPVTPLPPLPPPPLVEVTHKTAGSCTYLCNIQRPIDFITPEPIKHSSSRPPSRLMYDAELIKCEANMPSPIVNSKSSLPSALNAFLQAPAAPANLQTTTFEEIWQVFGHMLLGLLQHHNMGMSSSIITNPGNQLDALSQQEFQNFMRFLYDNMQEIPRPQTPFDAADASAATNVLLPQPHTKENCAPGVEERVFKLQATDLYTPRTSVETTSVRDISTIDCNEMSNTICKPETELHSGSEFKIPLNRTIKLAAQPVHLVDNLESKLVDKILNLFPHTEQSKDKRLAIRKLIKHGTKRHKNRIKKVKGSKCFLSEIHNFEALETNETAVDFLTKFSNLKSTEVQTNFAVDSIYAEKVYKEHNLPQFAETRLQVKQQQNQPEGNQELELEVFKKVDAINADALCEENAEWSMEVKAKKCSTFNNEFHLKAITKTINVQKYDDELNAFSKKEFYVQNAREDTENEGRKIAEACHKKEPNTMKTACEFFNTSDAAIETIQVGVVGFLPDDSISDDDNAASKVYSADRAENVNDISCNPTEQNLSDISTVMDSELLQDSLSDSQTVLIVDELLQREEASLGLDAVKEEQILARVAVENGFNRNSISDTSTNICSGEASNRCGKRKISACATQQPPYKRSARLRAKKMLLGVTSINECVLKLSKNTHTRELDSFDCSGSSTPKVAPSTECKHNKPGKAYCRTQLATCVADSEDSDDMSLQIDLGDYRERDCTETGTQLTTLVNLNAEEHLQKSIRTASAARATSIDATLHVPMAKLDATSAPSSAASAPLLPSPANDSSSQDPTLTIKASPVDDIIVYESPTSPAAADINAGDSSISPISAYSRLCLIPRVIPVETPMDSWSQRNSLLSQLISCYSAVQYKPLHVKLSTKALVHREALDAQLHKYIKFYLDSPVDQQPLEAAAVRLAQSLQQTADNPELIAVAIVEQAKQVPRPEIELASATTPAKTNSAFCHRMALVLKTLQQQQQQIVGQLIAKIEGELFNCLQADKLSLHAALNLTQLYLLLIVDQLPQAQRSPARLFIAKCLYYHQLKAIPMIYELLCWCPTALPHREERSYDRSNALITVIQHALMCTTYDMDRRELRTKELLSKLRFEYHFEPFKPDQFEVLKNLMDKLQAGKLTDVHYALAVFCKRQHPSKVMANVLQAQLLPLANQYYPLVLKASDYDERAAALLTCISMVVKPFPLDTDVTPYLSIFARYLVAVSRACVQEAAVQAILRLQRFGYVNCYNVLLLFKPGYELQYQTKAMLKTFIHRKPPSFWKTLRTQFQIMGN